jgi:hypothetical protein
MLIKFTLKAKEKLAKNKANEVEVKSQPQTKARKFPMKKRIITRKRLKLHTVTWREEEFPEEYRVVEENILEEEAEEE